MPFIEYLKLIQHLKGFTAIEKTILVLLLLAGVGGVLVLGSAFTVWQILVAVLCILALAWYLFSIRRSKLSRGRRRLVFGLLSLMTVAYVIAAGLASTWTKLHVDAKLRKAQVLKAAGNYDESSKLIREVLAMPDAQRSNSQTTLGLSQLGQIEIAQGDWPQADVALHEALAKAMGSPREEGEASLWLGELADFRGDETTATSYLQDALRFFHDANDRQGEADATLQIGRAMTVGNSPDYNAAKEQCTKALNMYSSLGSVSGTAEVFMCYGDIENNLSQFSEAQNDYGKAIEAYKKVGGVIGQADALVKLGDINADLTKFALAMQQYTDGLTLYEKVGCKWGTANALSGLGDVAQKQGPNSFALTQYSRGLEIFRLMDNERGVASILLGKGIVETHQGDFKQAETDLKDAMNTYLKLQNTKGQGEVRVAMGNLELEQGNYSEAQIDFGAALKIFGASTEREMSASALCGRADVERALGGRLEAQGDYQAAFDSFSDPKNSLGQGVATKGLASLEMENQNKALDSYKRAMDLYQEANDQRGQADIFKALGDLANKSGDRVLAHKDYDLAYGIYRKLEDNRKAEAVAKLIDSFSGSDAKKANTIN